MTFEEAKKIVELNQHLIGKKIKGAVIDELVIYPTNSNSYQEFIEIYKRTLDGKISISFFSKEDVNVYCVVDKIRIAQGQVFGHISLHAISDKYEVKYE